MGKNNYHSLIIENVDNRIKLLYGNDYGATISSKINVGTTINIYLPLIK